jgi:hypothetical protein
MNVMKLMVVALAGWISRQQVALLETSGRSVLGTLPPGTESPGIGETRSSNQILDRKGGVNCHERLGGLLRYYREAA